MPQKAGTLGAAGGPEGLRRTKIIATLGPASESEPVLRRLIAAGMNVARLNFSHGTRAEHGRTIRMVRRLAREARACRQRPAKRGLASAHLPGEPAARRSS